MIKIVSLSAFSARAISFCFELGGIRKNAPSRVVESGGFESIAGYAHILCSTVARKVAMFS